MKRLFVILITLLFLMGAVLSVIAGGQPDAKAEAEPVTIRLVTYWTAASYFTPFYEEVKDQMIKEFPNLKIQNEGLESAAARDKYAVEFASGNPPDISLLAPSFAREYAKQGLLLDLWPAIKADQEWHDQYTKAAINSFVWDGKMVISPLSTNYGSLFYNKRVFSKVGLSDAPKTWSDLIAYVKKIRAEGTHPFLTGGKEYRWAWFLTQLMVRTSGVDKMAEMAGGDEITGLDKPENGFIHTLELFKELIDNKAFPKDVNGLPRDIARMMFVSDKGAMWYEGTWLIGIYKKLGGDDFHDNYLGLAPFPTVPGAKGDQIGGVSGPLGLSVSSKVSGRKQELVQELVKRICSPDVATKMLELHSRVMMIKVRDDADWSKVSKHMKYQIDYYGKIDKVAFPSDIYFAPPVDNAMKKIAAPAIVDGTMTPLQAAQDVNKRAIEYFKK